MLLRVGYEQIETLEEGATGQTEVNLGARREARSLDTLAVPFKKDDCSRWDQRFGRAMKIAT
jgi:hypothetical protein